MRGCCGGDSNSAKVAPEMGEDVSLIRIIKTC